MTKAPHYPALDSRNREVAAWIRSCSSPELANFHESALWRQYNLKEMTIDDRAMFAITVEADLTMAAAELRRRQEARQRGWHNPHQQKQDALESLRQTIKHSIDLTDLLEREGVAVRRDRRTEAHAPCLACGGKDRFIIWPAPDSHAVCRQCGFHTDVIGAAQSLWQIGFADAITRLAGDYLGYADRVAS